MSDCKGRQKLEGEDYDKYYKRRWTEIWMEIKEQDTHPSPIYFIIDKLLFAEWYALELLDELDTSNRTKHEPEGKPCPEPMCNDGMVQIGDWMVECGRCKGTGRV